MMEFSKSVFKAYDIRGKKEDVVPEIGRQLGKALVGSLNGKRLLIARDMRETSPQLAEAFIDGAVRMGAHVIDIGMSTTSLFNWAVTNLDVDYGAMITASHNPSEYNGIKVATSDGQPLSGEELYEKVTQLYEDATQTGDVEERQVIQDYLDAVIAAAGELPDFSGAQIVIDYGNGMGALTLRPLFERLHIDVTELYAEPNSDFPNHEANPAKEDTLVDIKNVVEEQHADLGIATDGDGDRIGFIDNKSRTLRGDQALALMAKTYLSMHEGNGVVVSPNHGWAGMRMIEDAGGDLVEERIGRTFIIKKMHETGACLGGEVSSHFFFKEFQNLESIDFALLFILKIWKQSGVSFAELTEDLRTYHNSGEVNTEVENKEVVLERLQETYAGTATVVNTLDGIRCEFGDDWWFIVRPSNTEPLIRLTVEAKTEEMMREKVEEVLQYIN